MSENSSALPSASRIYNRTLLGWHFCRLSCWFVFKTSGVSSLVNETNDEEMWRLYRTVPIYIMDVLCSGSIRPQTAGEQLFINSNKTKQTFPSLLLLRCRKPTWAGLEGKIDSGVWSRSAHHSWSHSAHLQLPCRFHSPPLHSWN